MSTQEKYVSILGLADDTLMFCIEKAFESYSKREYGNSFQVSPHESENATTGIIITITGLESFVKRMEYIVRNTKEYSHYLDRFDSSRCDKCKAVNYLPLYEKISKIIVNQLTKTEKDIQIDEGKLKTILQETSKVRNNITHNYLYEFSVTYDKDYELVNWDYVDVPKGKTKIKTDITSFLKMNKIPNQISFVDLLKILTVFDTVIKMMEHSIKGINYRFSGYHKLDGEYSQNLNEVLCYYLNEMVSLGKKEDVQDINKTIVKINKIITTHSSNNKDIEDELPKQLKKSSLLQDTIVNSVSYCSNCCEYSFVIKKHGINKCANCLSKSL